MLQDPTNMSYFHIKTLSIKIPQTTLNEMHSKPPIHSLGKLRVKVTPSLWQHLYFIRKLSTSECNGAIE